MLHDLFLIAAGGVKDLTIQFYSRINSAFQIKSDERSSTPGGQAVDGVGGCMGLDSLSVGAAALRDGGLGRGARNHVVGRPGGLVGGGGQGSPLQSGVLGGDRGPLRWGRRG